MNTYFIKENKKVESGKKMVKFKLDKKGQAASTFELLIAAIVALAILGVLLSVLNVIPWLNTKPTDATKTLLKTQTNMPGQEECTEKVTFDTSNSKLGTEAVVLDTGLDKDQVLFANPEGLSQFAFGGANGDDQHMLIYKPTNSYNVLMCIICSNSIEGLEGAISTNARSGDGDIDIPEYIEDDQTICVIYPRKTR